MPRSSDFVGHQNRAFYTITEIKPKRIFYSLLRLVCKKTQITKAKRTSINNYHQNNYKNGKTAKKATG